MTQQFLHNFDVLSIRLQESRVGAPERMPAVSMESAYALAAANLPEDHPRSSGFAAWVQCFPGYSAWAVPWMFFWACDTCSVTRVKRRTDAAREQSRTKEFPSGTRVFLSRKPAGSSVLIVDLVLPEITPWIFWPVTLTYSVQLAFPFMHGVAEAARRA